MNYIGAVKRPFSDFTKLLIGFVFLVVPILNILTGFFVRGYELECGKTAMKKSFKLPEWTSFLKLFVNGLLALIIGLIYLIPFFIFLFISIGSLIIEVIKNQTQITEELIMSSINSFTIPSLIITIILFFLGIYLIPIAIMNFVTKYRFKDGFDLLTVFKKAFTGRYILIVLFILAYAIGIYIISSLILYVFGLFSPELLVLIINNILSALTTFIIGVTAITLIGEAYPKL